MGTPWQHPVDKEHPATHPAQLTLAMPMLYPSLSSPLPSRQPLGSVRAV